MILAWNLGLQAATHFELVVKLEIDKWVWSPGVSPGSRRKKDEPIQDAYVLGAEIKHWYSGMAPMRTYLCALLLSEDGLWKTGDQ